MTHYNPWAHAARLRIPVHYRGDLPDGTWGLSNGERIWLADHQFSREMRSTLTHELVHIELGHSTRQSPTTEDEVDLLAARRLVDERSLSWALKQTTDPERAAELLDVDDRMVRVLLEACR